MFLIIFTGNYNFFNWFSIALCLPLVNDYWIASWTRHQSVGRFYFVVRWWLGLLVFELTAL